MDEELKRRAYLEGLRLKNSGLEEEVIYARLEKNGIPEELARQVARNVMIQRVEDASKQEEPFYNIALIKIGLGILAAIISAFVLPGMIIVPVGLILTGVISALLHKSK